jgi:hypothetical protein
VLGLTETPTLTALDPPTASVNAGGRQTFTARLDLPPATANDLTVTLVPNTFGVAPMTVTVPADAMTVSFDVTVDAAATGNGTLTVSLGSTSLMSTLSVRMQATATNLLISEYGEGNSNNKYLEIFNGTGQQVDLTNYTVKNYANGATAPTNTLALTGLLPDGQTYVICNLSIAAAFTGCDLKNAVIGFNGNDAVTLSQGTTVIDTIGVVGTNPPVSWTVCGNTSGAVDTILIRKSTVTSPTSNWVTSAGTNATDCQWQLFPATTEPLMLMNNTMGSHNLAP